MILNRALKCFNNTHLRTISFKPSRRILLVGDPHQLTIQHKLKDLTYLTVGGSGINSKHCYLFHEKPSNWFLIGPSPITRDFNDSLWCNKQFTNTLDLNNNLKSANMHFKTFWSTLINTKCFCSWAVLGVKTLKKKWLPRDFEIWLWKT